HPEGAPLRRRRRLIHMRVGIPIRLRAAGKRTRGGGPERTTIAPTVVGVFALVAAAIISWESHEQAVRWARRAVARIHSRIRGNQPTPDPGPVGRSSRRR